MYEIIKHLHSGFRFLVILLVLLAIVQSLSGWLGKKPYTESNRRLNLFAMVSVHIQFLLGIALYFLSPFVQFNGAAMKNFDTRYWTSEHITMMLIAIVLITIGYSRSKKLVLPEAKHRTVAIFFIIGLVIISAAIVLSRRGFFQVTA